MERVRAWLASRLRTTSPLAREALAEMLGTAVLLSVGDGSVAQSVLSGGAKGGFLSINAGWGIAVMLGVYVSGGVSGGHLNPAISLAQCILGNITVLQLLIFTAAQLVGAILGAAIVFAIYFDALEAFDGGVRQIDGPNGTAGIFATYPQPFLSIGSGFADQVFGTCLLSLAVMSFTDGRNMNVPSALVPVLVGLTVGAIGLSFGFNCGYAINPARDLGPRLFTTFAGWGTACFSVRDYNWFWVPILGPYLGAFLGAMAYKICVGLHLEPPKAPHVPSTPSSLDVNHSHSQQGPKYAPSYTTAHTSSSH